MCRDSGTTVNDLSCRVKPLHWKLAQQIEVAEFARCKRKRMVEMRLCQWVFREKIGVSNRLPLFKLPYPHTSGYTGYKIDDGNIR